MLGTAMARVVARQAWRDLMTRIGVIGGEPAALFGHWSVCRLPERFAMKALFAMFITVFLAELGDKTQLATMLFASGRQLSPWLIFLACAGALVASSAIAVTLGTLAAHHLEMLPLKLIAGLGFIAIGVWTLYGHFAAT